MILIKKSEVITQVKNNQNFFMLDLILLEITTSTKAIAIQRQNQFTHLVS